ncbi:hypothetical protein BKA70DRAFT_1231032 [Coprinopsis sp. MPI-PUGE-AT-0042]|nr:hypothetical protein BKA70DRAFT_1231032 [Coprinopsis sp. MPI-PUGE-AT-0042]
MLSKARVKIRIDRGLEIPCPPSVMMTVSASMILVSKGLIYSDCKRALNTVKGLTPVTYAQEFEPEKQPPVGAKVGRSILLVRDFGSTHSVLWGSGILIPSPELEGPPDDLNIRIPASSSCRKDFKAWSSLEVLALDIPPTSDFEVELGNQALPALEYLYLSYGCLKGIWHVVPALVPSIRVTHSRMTTLCLSDTEDQALPALEYLYLSYGCLKGIWHVVPALVPSIRVTHSRMTTLCLSDTEVINHEWLKTFFDPSNVSKLRTLVLQHLLFVHDEADWQTDLPPIVLQLVVAKHAQTNVQFARLAFLELRLFCQTSRLRGLTDPAYAPGYLALILRHLKTFLPVQILSIGVIAALFQGDSLQDKPLIHTIVCGSPVFEEESVYADTSGDVPYELVQHVRA